jgi:hypothetical protein
VYCSKHLIQNTVHVWFLSYCAALVLFKFSNSKYSTMIIVWDLMIQHFQYPSIQTGTSFKRKGITAASGET